MVRGFLAGAINADGAGYNTTRPLAILRRPVMITSVSTAESKAELLLTLFRRRFCTSARIFRAPGRVNLIGEHTDYNDGFVMPMAIGFYTWVAAAPREDRILEAYSAHFDERIRLSLDSLAGPPRKHWSDFVRGVAATLQAAGHTLDGANLVIDGEVPFGAGLSSSASLEVSVALALISLGGSGLPGLELVKLCQKAEHEYVGTRCGIMDQFVARFGAEGKALFLDCRSLGFQLLPVPQGLTVVVCNSLVRHELASGEYNQRRSDCETGVRRLQSFLPAIRALRDVEIRDLERHKNDLSETVYRRCRHVISENQRVKEAAKALEGKDAARFGELMYDSHASLRDDYNVSCRELDLLVDLASSKPGVYGARMMGGGFGGCTVNLVRSDCVAEFRAAIAKEYAAATGTTPPIYICEAAQAAGAWPIEGSFST